MSRWDHHPPCPGGCGELADECMTPGCGSPLGSMRIERPVTRIELMETLRRKPVYGMCLGCRSIEVRLDSVIGTRDLSYMGESAEYPVGYGCEVCS